MGFTSYGIRELTVFGGITLALACACGVGAWLAAGMTGRLLWGVGGVISLALCLLVLSFFRDPERSLPTGTGLIISPADGVVTDIEIVDEPQFIKGKARRIGIFMSVFNVHVNRNPIHGVVRFLRHEEGRFDAVFTAEAAKGNEKQWTGLESDLNPRKLMVCQVAGLLARRIVCPLMIGQPVRQGERFGMIKFGSRLEVYIPEHVPHSVKVTIGQKTVAGETLLMECPP